MKNSMRTVNAEFNTTRMVEEYTQRFYVPCIEQSRKLAVEASSAARELADWRRTVRQHWVALQVLSIDAGDQEAQPMGSRFPVHAVLELGELNTDDILVEIYHGLLDTQGRIVGGETETMAPEGKATTGRVTYVADIPCRRSGQRGFTVRVTPRNPNFPLNRFDTGLIRWFGEETEIRPLSTHGMRI